MNPRLTFLFGILFMLIGVWLSANALYTTRVITLDTNIRRREIFILKDHALAVFDSLRSIKCIPQRTASSGKWYYVDK